MRLYGEYPAGVARLTPRYDRIWRTRASPPSIPGADGLGVVEDGILASLDGRIAYAGPAAGFSGSPATRSIARPLDHAGPRRLPHPSRPWRRPRAGVRDAPCRRDLSGDRRRRRRHPLDGRGDAGGERGRARRLRPRPPRRPHSPRASRRSRSSPAMASRSKPNCACCVRRDASARRRPVRVSRAFWARMPFRPA